MSEIINLVRRYKAYQVLSVVDGKAKTSIGTYNLPKEPKGVAKGWYMVVESRTGMFEYMNKARMDSIFQEQE